MAKMDIDDVVDLSLSSGRDSGLSLTQAAVRDLRALAQNSGLTITPAPPPNSIHGHQLNSGGINNSSGSGRIMCGGSMMGSAGSGRRNSTPTTTNNISTTITSVNASCNPGIQNPTSGGNNGGNIHNNNNATVITPVPFEENKEHRRVLRPRTEPKSYAEAPDIVLLPIRMNGRQQNGNIDSETDDEEMPMYHPIKELTSTEIKERELNLRKLRDDLRNEETKLILLKKLKQSQYVMKENLALTPTNISSNNPLAAIPAALTSKGALSVTPTNNISYSPTHNKSSRNNCNNIPSSITISRSSGNNNSSLPSSINGMPVYRSNNNANVLTSSRSAISGGIGGSSSSISISPATAASPRPMNSLPNRNNLPNLTITPSVTITPTTVPPSGYKTRNVPNTVSNSVSITPAPPPPGHSQHHADIKNDRLISREDTQNSGQKQAAAKMALRKQLEKTLLQIPPPKPPPPEMHFIPNPSNTEFVYLLGLETVVDYLMHIFRKTNTMMPPLRCGQCKVDFTPSWKFEKQGNKEVKVICEQCVITNIKKALKAEHTYRLKQAFVKALQQEHEIEQRLARQGTPSPNDIHAVGASTSLQTQQIAAHNPSAAAAAALVNLPPSVTVIPTKCHTPTASLTPRPTPPPPNQPTPPPPSAHSNARARNLTCHQNQVNNNTPNSVQMHHQSQLRDRDRDIHRNEQQQQHQHHQQHQQHQQHPQHHSQQHQQPQSLSQQQQQQQSTQPNQQSAQQAAQQQYDKYSAAVLAAAAQLNALGMPGINLAALGLSNMGNLGNINQLNNLAALGGLANLGAAGATNPATAAAAAANLNQIGNTSPANAAAMQAFQQQLFRALGQGLAVSPQHMMQLAPILYSYQMAMAQVANAAASSKNSSATINDIQRAAEMQRQYLMDMILPQVQGQNNNRSNNWKT